MPEESVDKLLDRLTCALRELRHVRSACDSAITEVMNSMQERRSREELNRTFLVAVEMYGPDVTLREIKSLAGGHIARVVRKHYGSWNGIRKAFGLPVNEPGRKKGCRKLSEGEME